METWRARKPRRRIVESAVALTAGLALLTGCAVDQGEALSDNTLVIAIESEADLLDPQVAGGWVTWRINSQIFEPLVFQDLRTPSADAQVPEIQPGLAESWEMSDDGLTYTFHLRDDVTFHDGTEFDADAVEYNVRRMWDESAPQYSARAAGQTAFIWKFLKDVRTVDDLTVELELTQPFSAFIRMLSQGGTGSTAMMSPAAVEEFGEDIADHPVGTGPFRFDERIRGQRISLVRNDDYWGTVPELDGVTFRPMADASARIAALRADEVDIVTVPSPDSVGLLQDEGFQISDGTPPHTWYLSFNMENEYTRIKEVREAINLAIDREGLASSLLSDTVLPAYDVQSPATPTYVRRDDLYTRDLERAEELMAEAGLEDGFSTTLMTSVDGSGQIIPSEMAEYIQQNLAEIDIDVELQTQEWISYLTTWGQGMPESAGMAQMSWGMTTPYWIYIIMSSERQAPNGANVGYFSDEELDAAMDRAISALSEEESVPHWREANDIVAEEAAMAPIVNDKAPYALSPRVTGFVSASEEWYDLKEVGLE